MGPTDYFIFVYTFQQLKQLNPKSPPKEQEQLLSSGELGRGAFLFGYERSIVAPLAFNLRDVIHSINCHSLIPYFRFNLVRHRTTPVQYYHKNQKSSGHKRLEFDGGGDPTPAREKGSGSIREAELAETMNRLVPVIEI
ncbi:unnamed protein product [Lupinus luteus]|uniref:Uncharacterized protein n=1 Tax=Lupinus luteus TaxID=3873 RepID=A0AAV1Y171_LUPLU